MSEGGVIALALGLLGSGSALGVIIKSMLDRRQVAAQAKKVEAEAKKVEIDGAHVRLSGFIEVGELAQAIAKDLREDVIRLKAQVEELETEMEAVQKENIALTSRVMLLESENESLRGRVRALEFENTKLREENNNLKASE